MVGSYNGPFMVVSNPMNGPNHFVIQRKRRETIFYPSWYFVSVTFTVKFLTVSVADLWLLSLC